jgi:hypothetical protein
MKDHITVGVKVTAPLFLYAQAWAGVLWRVALTFLLLVMTEGVIKVGHYGPAWVQAQIQREGDATRADALKAIADTRADALRAIADTRRDLLARVDAGLVDADQQLATLNATVSQQLGAANASISKVAGIRDDLQPLVKPVQNTLDVVSDNADLLGRCDHNPDCVANRLIPAMKNFERMAAAGEVTFKAVSAEAAPTSKAVREGAQQITGIATDVHTATTDAVKPEPWYKKTGNVAYALLVLLSHWL